MMKKLLSTLVTAAFMGTAYAGSLTVGAQINPYIKYKDNNVEDPRLVYDVDFGKDTKAFLIYNDNDVTGKLVLITPDQSVKVGVALLKVKKLLGTPVYMIIGKQPNILDVYDFSITDVYSVNSTALAPKKVTGVTLGLNLNPITIQGTVINTNTKEDTNTPVAKAFEVGVLGNLGVVNAALALDYLRQNGDDNNAYLLYAYLGTKAVQAVNLEVQGSYSSDTSDNKAKVYTVATSISAKKPLKLLYKPATPYFTFQYSHWNDEYRGLYDYEQWIVRDDKDGVKNKVKDAKSEIAVKTGLKIKYNDNVMHNDYVKYIKVKDLHYFEVASDWVIKFAKTIK